MRALLGARRRFEPCMYAWLCNPFYKIVRYNNWYYYCVNRRWDSPEGGSFYPRIGGLAI